MNSKVSLVARILLGIGLVVFGANKFFNFMPAMEMPEQAGNFMGAIMQTGYLFPMIAIIEIIAGLLFLINKKVPLALLLWTPVLVNILVFHAFLDPMTILPGAIFAILTIIIYKENWNSFKEIV